MEVAVDVDGGVGKFFLLEIISGGEADFPFFGDVEVAADVQRLHNRACMGFQGVFFRDVVERIEGRIHIVIGVILDGIGEGIAEGE